MKLNQSLYVVLGEYDTKTNPDCDDGIFKKNCAAPIQRIKIAHINVPKSYVPKDYRNDISLLKLKRPAHLNGKIFLGVKIFFRNEDRLKNLEQIILLIFSCLGWVSPICLPTGTEIFGVTAEVGKSIAKLFEYYSNLKKILILISWMGNDEKKSDN